MGKRILVTGGAGFVAGNTILELKRLGYEVIPIDINTTSSVDPSIEVVKGDILSSTIADYINEGDKILHLCALPIFEADPVKIFHLNVTGTINLVQKAIAKKAERIVFASSGAVYFGNYDIHPPISELTPINPNTYYGFSKIVGEQILDRHKNELPYVVLRYGYIYGKGKLLIGAINLWMKLLMEGKQPTIFWGKQLVEFVYIKDIVQSNILALETRNLNEIYNIGSGTSITLRGAYDILCSIMGKKVEPIIKSLRAWDPPSFYYDIRKAIEKLGYSPKWTLTEGIKDVLNELYGDKSQ